MPDYSKPIPVNGGPKLKSFTQLPSRLNTYTNWPRALEQRPQEMATAGFFYTNLGDQVQCFYCAGGLKGWAPDDIPWIEHARWFPECTYLLLHKGNDFVGKVQNKYKNSPR